MIIVGIITALRIEASCISTFRMPYRRMARIADCSVVWLGGMGEEAARLAATELLDRGAEALVSFGISGALDPNLNPGDLILPELIHSGVISQNSEEESPGYPVSLEWRSRIVELLQPHMSVVGGTMTTSADVLTSAEEKLELGAATGACAVDLESAAIAEVAAKAGVPFIAIRAITNPVDYAPPAALLRVIRPDGSIKTMHLLFLLYQRTVSFSMLLRLWREIRAARSTLASVVRHASKELGNMPRTVTLT